MKVHVPPRLSGLKGTTSVLEIDLTTRARRVRVRTSEGLESLDLRGERVTALYDLPDGVTRVHVPLRVSRDGPGRARVQVTLEDAKGALPPETWEGDVILDAAPVVRRSRGNALVGLGFAALVGAIAWFVVPPLFQQSQVPSLLNRPRSDAERLVKAKGWAAVVETVDAPEGATPDTVLGQKPEPGVRLGKDEAVVITVGRAPDSDLVPVPSLVGGTEAQAAAALEGKGFRLRTTPVEASGVLEGIVNSQRPLAGARLAPGSTVEIFVGRPRAAEPERREVPNVVGLTPEAAEAALRDAKLAMTLSGLPEPAAPELAGRVLRQDPAAGAFVAEGSRVTLVTGIHDATVAGPVEPVAMAPDAPPVVPPTPPVPADPVPADPVPAGPVPADPVPAEPVAMAPDAPPAVPPTPPAPPVAPPVEPANPAGEGTPAPDVLGLDRKAAQAAVRAAGFLWREIPDDVPDEDPEGIVVRQTPAPGKPVYDGNVELVVSRHAAKVVAPPAPDVVGRTEANARAVLTGSRYHVSVEYEDVDAPRVGLVLRQVPPAGTPTPDPEATWVEIVVGRLAPKPPVAPPTPPTPPVEPPVAPPTPPTPPVEPPVVPPTPPTPPVEPPVVPPTPPTPPVESPVAPPTPPTPPVEPPVVPPTPPTPPVEPPVVPPTPPTPPVEPPVVPPTPPTPPVEPPVVPPTPPTPPVEPPVVPPTPPTPPVEPPVVPPTPPTPPVEPPVVPPTPPVPPVAAPPSGALPPPSAPRGVPDATRQSLTVPPGPPEPPMPSLPRPTPAPLPMPPLTPPAAGAPPPTAGPGLPPPLEARAVETSKVPPLTDLDADAAIRLAIESGLVPQVVPDRDPRVPLGRVSRSSPAAGVEARTGTPVTLSVGVGAAAPGADVPNLVGLTVARALDRLNAMSLRTEIVSVRSKAGVFPVGDLVLAQLPVGPFAMSTGPVRLYVSGR